MALHFRILALLGADILVKFIFFTMQNYLTDVWQISLTRAAGILNIWEGICMILPIFFLFLADQFLGHFVMLVISSILHSVGISMVVMSTPPVIANLTNTCKEEDPECISHTHKLVFFIGMSLLAVGLAGHSASVMPFEVEQFPNTDDEDENNVSNRETCSIVTGLVVLAFGTLIAVFLFPYIPWWAVRFGILAICSVVVTLLFLSGSCVYKEVGPKGSPLTNVCRVFVASALKISIPVPTDVEKFYREHESGPQSFTNTRFLSCFEKASIILPGEIGRNRQVNNRWKLCSISDVEEAKIVFRMVPIWLTFIVCGIVSSIGKTYFAEQANNLNHKFLNGEFDSVNLYLVYCAIKYWFLRCGAYYFIKKYKAYGPPLGIGVAMISSILCCIIAAVIETKRLKVIKINGLLDKPDEDIPMSVCWLVFQFLMLAGLDSFLSESGDALYDNEGPKSMTKYLNRFAKAVNGVGYMCGVLSVYVIGKVSQIGGRRNWFQETLNESRLDRYYWVLAAISSVNLLVYIMVASTYTYHVHEPRTREEETGVETNDGNDTTR